MTARARMRMRETLRMRIRGAEYLVCALCAAGVVRAAPVLGGGI